jgi:two-component system LytT family response regulator
MSRTPRTAAIDPRQGLRDLGLGFVYWLGLVLVLEPGNLMRWTPPDAVAWSHEVLRLLGAGLLGAAATPAILTLTRRLPIEGPSACRRAGVHVAFGLGVTLLLIVVSCLLAAVGPLASHRPLMRDIGEELGANGLLVAAWIAGLTALAHATRRPRHAGPADEGRPSGLTIRQRGRFARVDLAEVDWIETQGNYLALHGSTSVRLLRQTAKSLQNEIDPRRFVRVHRRAIVAVDAVRTVTPLAAGDALLRLRSGKDLRVSRSCRAGLYRALDAVRD